MKPYGIVLQGVLKVGTGAGLQHSLINLLFARSFAYQCCKTACTRKLRVRLNLRVLLHVR